MEDFLSRNNMTREEAEALIGPETERYLYKWDMHLDSAFKGWSWIGFFFPMEWLAYRKMYAEVAICYLISFAISTITLTLDWFTMLNDSAVLGISYLVGITFSILLAAFCNTLYQKKVLRIYKKVKAQEEFNPIQQMREKGGTSGTALIIWIVLSIVLAVIRYIFLIYIARVVV